VLITEASVPIQVQIAKWGNSLGLRVPRDVAARVGLTEGARVDIEACDDGRIIITRSRRRFTLEELLAGMTPEREHVLEDDGPRGEEIL
jgi:antitoxin MazE